MKSENFSELQVLRSAGGYYIGRMYADEDMGGMLVPGTRESDYFESEEEAASALKHGFPVRQCMENDMLYSSCVLPYPGY